MSLLQSLIEAGEEAPVLVTEEGIFQENRRLDRKWDGASSDEIAARVEILLRSLSLPQLEPLELERIWRPLTQRPARRHEYFNALRGSRPSEAADPSSSWIAAITRELREVGDETDGGTDFIEALDGWRRHVMVDPQWKFTESLMPGVPGLPLDHVWVELQLFKPDDLPDLGYVDPRPGVLSSFRGLRRWQSDTLELAIERLDGSATLIGPPGCGKTTMLMWLTRKLILEAKQRFLLPLFVPLRHYVLTGNEGLLQFAVRTCLANEEPGKQTAWAGLLRRLARSDRSHVVLLLDGWDEVPVNRRESLLLELTELGRRFAMVVTSRPSGYPRSLPTRQDYEILELSEEGSVSLVEQWFEGHGRPYLAPRVLRHLETQSDLRELSRSPFLLTLLCGLTLIAEKTKSPDLPASRAELYERTIEVIFQQHNERYPARELTSRDLRLIDRLSLWLLDDAPSAPRFVFDDSDVEIATGEAGLLERLSPARLLTRQRGARGATSFHFLHATFQEHFAARAIQSLPGEEAERRLRRHLHDLAWQEVRFFLLSRDDRVGRLLWAGIAEEYREPDRYHLLDVRLARLLAAVRVEDGGKELLGFDVRDRLWSAILRMAPVSRHYVDAFLKLDPEDLARRIDIELGQGARDPTLRASLENIQVSSRDSLVTREQASSLLEGGILTSWFQYSGRRFSHQALQILRKGLEAESLERRQNALEILAGLRDREAVPAISRLAGRDLPDDPSPLWLKAIKALGQIGGHQANRYLLDLLAASPGRSSLQPVVEALANGRIHTLEIRDVLLRELALRTMEDPLAKPLLLALRHTPVHHGRLLISALILTPECAFRSLAAEVLQQAVGELPAAALAELACQDPDENLRIELLELLAVVGAWPDLEWLRERAADPELSAKERGAALEGLLKLTGRNREGSEGKEIVRSALELVEEALRVPAGILADKAASFAHLLGPAAGPILTATCRDGRAEKRVRVAAIFALRKLRYQPAAEALLELVRAAPDVEQFFDPPPGQPLHEDLARKAAGTLAILCPELLLKESGSTCYFALQEHAFRTESLIFEDRVVGPTGQVSHRFLPELGWVSGSRLLALPDETSPAEGHAGSALQVDPPVPLWIILRKPAHGGWILEHELWSPSGARLLLSARDQTPPFSENLWERKNQEIFKRLDDIVRENVAEVPIPSQDLARELRVVGETLWLEFVPAKLQELFRSQGGEFESLLIKSNESGIPWELTVIDGRHLCCRYRLGRWFTQKPGPRSCFKITNLLGLMAGTVKSFETLPFVDAEKSLLEQILGETADLVGKVSSSPTLGEVLTDLEHQAFDWIHFAGHASFDPERPTESGLELRDQRLRADHLGPAILENLKNRRPLIFQNACHSARQGFFLAGWGGWPSRWIQLGECGALICPQWAVRDVTACEFSEGVYQRLRQGKTLGEALRATREDLLAKDPDDLTPLAYAYFGHPDARVHFGLD